MITPNPSTVGTADAKTHFSELLDRVERGEEITITRHGEPVARLVPTSRHDAAKASEAIEQWLSSPNRPTLGGLSWKALRDEGRR